jgi:hypothetical protein
VNDKNASGILPALVKSGFWRGARTSTDQEKNKQERARKVSQWFQGNAGQGCLPPARRR